MYKRQWSEAFRFVLIFLPVSLVLLIMSNGPTMPGKTRHGVRFHHGPQNLNATPIRAGSNSSTKIGETQQEIRASLWGRVLVDDLNLVKNLIKPQLVDDTLVTAIATSINMKEELKAAYVALKNRAEIEDVYGSPLPNIPLFLIFLQRLDAILLSLGLTLVLSAAYVTSSLGALARAPPYPGVRVGVEGEKTGEGRKNNDTRFFFFRLHINKEGVYAVPQQFPTRLRLVYHYRIS
jgi:hypothetical protein